MISKRNVLILIACLITVFLIWPLSEPTYSYSTVLNDQKGELLGASIASDGQWRFPEPDSVPIKITACIRYFEDQYFYYHPGINPLAVARATRQNIAAGKVVSGASTITMQVARMMRNRERTFSQKIIEMLWAVKLELKYSKKEILTKYLSMAPFGGNVVGAEAASWRYFNRPPHLLSWGEAASLAVLPNNPGAIFPGRSNEKYKEKRDRLLLTLLKESVIDTITYELSLLESLPEKPFPIPQKAKHLLSTIKKVQPGTITNSSIDPFWQQQTTQIVERHHQRQLANGVENICAMVVDLSSGSTLSYVGNTLDAQSQGHQVDIIQKARSPGSSLKPLLYAHALSSGRVLPGSLLPDIPTFFGGYSPKNFSLDYDGAVPANQALSRSLNIPFVYLLKDYTYEQFHSDLQKLGFTTLTKSPGHYGLSLVLGGAEVSLWELSGAYLQLYQKLANRPSTVIHYDNAQNQPKSTVDPAPAAIWHTFQAMTELSRPDGENNWESYASSQVISWKTGTSFGFRDAWAIGLNGTILVGVWVGNADGEGRAGLTGINAAAPLFLEIIRLSEHNRNWLSALQPLMNEMLVCQQSGFLASEHCPAKRAGVPRLAENSGLCPYHQAFFMDSTNTYRVNSSCYSLSKSTRQSHFVLPSNIGTYYKLSHTDYKGLPPMHSMCNAETENPIGIVYPNVRSKVFIPKEISGEKGKLVLEASHQDATASLFWSIDHSFYGRTRDSHKLEIHLTKGHHTLTLTDSHGNMKTQTFEVISK